MVAPSKIDHEGIIATTMSLYNIEPSSPTNNCQENDGIQDGLISGSTEHQDLSMIAVLGNCLFSLAFLSSSFFVDSIEMGFIAFRLLVIAAHIITSYVAIHKKCDTRVILWSTLFVLVNIYKLLQIAYNHKPIR